MFWELVRQSAITPTATALKKWHEENDDELPNNSRARRHEDGEDVLLRDYPSAQIDPRR